MYKYTQVLFFLSCSRGILSWNSHRLPNSISDFYSHPDLSRLDDGNSDTDSWPFGNYERRYFHEGPDNDYGSRITFPDEDKDDLSNFRHKEDNVHPQHFILKCIRSCPVTNEYNPVCGTDDITYNNLEHLRCVRGCGDDVQLQHLSACKDFTETSTELTTTTNTNIDSCLTMCPTTSEYSPVCGTDNVTYKNIGKLSCAQICGVAVEVKRRLPCPKKTTDEDLSTTEDPTETTTVNSRYYQLCMDSCPTTTEYKPVCASNGKTYYNTGKFQCAKSCGLNISIQDLGVCEIINSGEADTLGSTTTSTTTMPSISNKQPVTTLQNLLDKIFSSEDSSDPKLDVRHS